ncbi:hypothetical protein D3C86_2078690 [compost metagenome]
MKRCIYTRSQRIVIVIITDCFLQNKRGHGQEQSRDGVVPFDRKNLIEINDADEHA